MKFSYGYVYISKNEVDGTRYVGQHKGKFDPSYKGSGVFLILAIKKYGKENFSVRPVEYAETPQQLNEKEKKWIAKTNAADSKKYYNISRNAGGPGDAKKTEEHKRNIGLSQKRTWKVRGPMSNEQRSKMGTNKLGTKYRLGIKRLRTAEHNRKISASMQGKKNALGHRKKVTPLSFL